MIFHIHIMIKAKWTAINYIESSNKLESNTTELDAQDNCTTFSNAYTSSNFDTGKKVCELFIKLYNSLSNVENGNKPDDTKDWHFLNYWLNINISKRKLNKSTCATKFSDGLSHHCTYTFSYEFPPEFIYNIREEELIKMNLLYSLYENYKKLDNILNGQKPVNAGSLLGPSAKCCSDYAEANYLCNDKNNEFCTQLKKFKEKYDGLYNTEIEGKPEYTNNFIKLSQCDNNTMSKALIGTTVGLVPLLVGLYKFTPLRQLMNFKKGKLAEQYRNNDDEMRDIMLMDQGSEHISSQQGRYNIKYHSV
ncbi:variable surface protein Vir30, putative [Plasmodium vivax]|uniref:Variable surface protein Vir30, putative n=1 Tax=Plasmodium vivax (strain Salvador I) TaxID=126793 RepID=A5KDA1_PLAVS|nr:variable surface protein Vir30, putative [Plasmodium vivax]EDL42668.1 variable surface protein Vir30, putative [Plasmodium vivax]|eukprot:XP_001612461.1 variable surface protein Vir30 [Plasmodium vivax Sal-1]